MNNNKDCRVGQLTNDDDDDDGDGQVPVHVQAVAQLDLQAYVIISNILNCLKDIFNWLQNILKWIFSMKMLNQLSFLQVKFASSPACVAPAEKNISPV